MRLFSILFIFCFKTVSAQVLWQFSEDTVIEWTGVFVDEFNKKEVDEDKWWIGAPFGRAMIGQSNYILPSNVKVQNGRLDLITKPLDSLVRLNPSEIDSNAIRQKGLTLTDGNKLRFQYSAAMLWSKKEFSSGYFEIKFRGVAGQGIWPAFWLYGGNPNYEIDFFELKGEKEQFMHVDVHCPDGCANFKEGWFGYRRGFGHWVKTDNSLSDGYNIVSGEWNSEGVKWYLNGELAAVFAQKLAQPMALILNNSMAQDNGPFSPGANKETKFPSVFSIEYVRVYQTGIKEAAPLPALNDTITPLTYTTTLVKTKRVTKADRRRLITVSVVKGTDQLFIRCLGLQDNENVRVFFLQDGNTIHEQIISTNSEFPINLAGLKNLTLKIQALGRVKTYKLN